MKIFAMNAMNHAMAALDLDLKTVIPVLLIIIIIKEDV